MGKLLWRSVVSIAIIMAVLHGCERNPAEKPTDIEGALGISLNWLGQPFDIMIDDLDADGDQDIFAIDHGRNMGQTFLQDKLRMFTKTQSFGGVGFHPGNIMAWPSSGQDRPYILAAEGENQIKVLLSSAQGFEVKHALPAYRPRYAVNFNWRGWGKSLAISPYDVDEIHLLKDFHPLEGKAKSNIVIPLAKKRPSVLWPGRITVADADGDGADELYYATSATKEIFVIRSPKSKKMPPISMRVHKGGKGWGIVDSVIDADMDGDGRIDLIAPSMSPPGAINVLLNQGKEKWKLSKPLDTLSTRGVTQLKTAIEKDGMRYLVAGGYGQLAIYRMSKSWTPGQTTERREIKWKGISHVSALCLQDVDADGWLDLVIGRWQGDSTINVLFGPLWEQFGQSLNNPQAL